MAGNEVQILCYFTEALFTLTSYISTQVSVLSAQNKLLKKKKII